jgi:hypothetical protein
MLTNKIYFALCSVCAVAGGFFGAGLAHRF